jgi:hypothetical protein
MAPRSRARSAQALPNTPSSLSINDLPEAVLGRCLSFLEFTERQRLALLSKRLAAAACSPELLRDVDVGVLDSLALLRSLTAWLARHGLHVRRLECNFDPVLSDSDAAVAIASCLATAGAAGQLEQLNLYSSFGSMEWLAAVRSLRRLKLVSHEGHQRADGAGKPGASG